MTRKDQGTLSPIIDEQIEEHIYNRTTTYNVLKTPGVALWQGEYVSWKCVSINCNKDTRT